MKKFYTIMGISAGVTLLIGAMLVAIGIGMGGLKKTYEKTVDFLNLDLVINPQMEEMEYTVIDEFTIADIETEVGDINILIGDEFAIEYSVYGELDYNISDGVLCITESDNNRINIGLSFINNDSYINIYIPDEVTLDEMKITSDVGGVECKGFAVSNVDISSDVGDILLTDMIVDNLIIEVATGDFTFTGDINQTASISSDVGGVELTGNLLTDIDIKSDVGDVELTTYYNSKAYDYDISTDVGDSIVNKDGGKECDEGYNITIQCDVGDVKLTFTDN